MASAASTQVFFDASGRRSRLLTRFVLFVVTILVIVFSIGLWSVARTPAFRAPTRGLDEGYSPSQHLISFQKGGGKVVQTNDLIALYVSGSEASLLSFQHHLEQIGTVIPDWLRTDANNGVVTNIRTNEEMTVFAEARQRRSDMRVMPALQLGSHQETWKRTLQQAPQYLQSLDASGLILDVPEVQSNFDTLLVSLSSDPRMAGKLLYLRTDDPSVITEVQQKLANKILFSLYDEHWSESKPGSLASDGWVTDRLKEVSVLPWANKAIPVFGLFGYSWKAGKTEAELIGFTELVHRATNFHIRPTYVPSEGLTLVNKHEEIWFSDAAMLYETINLAQKVKVFNHFGIAYLGLEDPGSWEVLTHSKPSSIINFEHDLEYVGEGEFTKLTHTANKGTRSFSFDASGQLIAETYATLPSAAIVQRAGRTVKKIALTFDDGPSEAATPDILEVLAKYDVPAAFFIIGSSASRDPALVQRIVREGHLLGNHTFYHSNVAAIPIRQLQMEINATERVIESETGMKSLLFRPPYDIDSEPSTEKQIAPLAVVADAGYVTVNMGIDPNDWRPGSSAEAITKSVIQQASAKKGNIVLLHDGGGDRSATVKALPAIITGLRSAGFSLVSLDELSGIQKDELMPSINQQEAVAGHINGFTLFILNLFRAAILFLFIGSIALGLLRLVFIGWHALHDRYSNKQKEKLIGILPSVAIIIPAYNEALVVLNTVESALASVYTNLRVLVIDDGSTDETFALLTKIYPQLPRLKFLRLPNGGKAAAINYALWMTEAEVVVLIDADTLIHPQAVALLAQHFVNPKVAAVAGNAKVGNRLNTLTRWQALEYIMGQNLDRRAFNRLNCICVVPGAIGAWRRSLVLECGGFRSDTLAEDTDLTLELLERGWKITYEERAYAYTEAPDTVTAFLKQRFRWVYGTLQAMWKRRHALLSRRFGTLGMVALPNMLLFQIFLPLLGPLMDFLMLASIAETYWQRVQHPESYSTDSVRKIFLYYIFFLCLEIATGVLALIIERKESWSLLFWLPIQRFFYRQVLYTAVIRSVLGAITGRAVVWNKLQRKATVLVNTG